MVPGATAGINQIYVRDTLTNQTFLASQSLLGAAADGDSGASQISADGGSIAFESVATNLLPVKDSDSVQDVFALDFTPRVVLTNGLPINNPPGVVPGRGRVQLVLQQFVLDSSPASLTADAASKTPVINYVVTLTNRSTKKVIKRTVKKNTLTVKNLKPGNYTVSYNAQVKSGRKILSKTRQSPKAKFKVR
jgi:hypothetical protein